MTGLTDTFRAVTETCACIHCGTPFRPTAVQAEFCCAGCRFVYELIRKNGLEQFYDLQDSARYPVKSVVFQKRDYTWLEELATIAEGIGPTATLPLELQGISCIGCVWLIERLFERSPGTLRIEVNSALGRMELQWRSGEFDIIRFASQLQSFGYLVGPPGLDSAPESSMLTKRLGVCAALAMNAMLFTLPHYLGMERDFEFAPLFNRIAFVFGTLSLVIGGSYFFGRTWHSLRNRVLHIDLPISLGIGAAYAGSIYAWQKGALDFVYFDFVSMFVFLMLVGRWVQLKAVEANRNMLLKADAGPPPVTLCASGERAGAEALAVGTRFRIGPGQLVPVRSKVCSASALLGLEWINGESEAQTMPAGRVAPSGAVNYGQSPVEFEAGETWNESLLSRLLEVTPRGLWRNETLERFIRAYIVVVLLVGTAGFGAWFLATGEVLPALQVLVSILVISCPCAAGVALPLNDELAAARLRRRGLFVREQSLWPRLARIRKVLFDKTGTLTLDTMAIRNPEALEGLDPAQRGVLLAMVNGNLHPVSCCLREQLLAAGVRPVETASTEEVIGSGLELRADGNVWRLGRPGWAGNGSQADCCFTLNGDPLAGFRFGENVRADAAEEVAALRKRGCEVFILSGDNPDKVSSMAARLDLPQEHCLGGLSPVEKAGWIRANDRRDTLMIGDGANDSFAFDASYCTGTPAIDRGLLERKADFYFLGRGLNGVRELFETAIVRRLTARRVVGFAISYNLCATIVCLAGRMNPLIAAIIMPLSSLISLGIVFLGTRERANGRPAGVRHSRRP